ncbi:MAG: hypothetical protein ACI8PG_004843 [Planctomycetota bacterium]|jgi:hypothetical protein
MTAIAQTIRQWGDSLSMPKVFDITVHYEPSAHFRFTRKIRNDFDELARLHAQSTWLLGSHGGKARMQTDIQGIGLATRLEVGCLSLRDGRQQQQLKSAIELCRLAGDRELSSGKVDRLLVRFPKAVLRYRERVHVHNAYREVFNSPSCSFLALEPGLLELGHCSAYQSIVQFMREDGLYHSAHRDNIEVLLRHLHQEVGRYENHKFYVCPRAVTGDIPEIRFVYAGESRDRSIEAYIEGYTEIRPEFVAREQFQNERSSYIGLRDYERASRRFGGIWVLQGDLVRHLTPNQVGVLYLFFDADMQPEEGRYLSWEELHRRQSQSPHIGKSARLSPSFLDAVIEELLRDNFLVSSGNSFALYPEFVDFEHVSFYSLGQYGKE